MVKPRVLRIFARYQQFGGEEAIAQRIHSDLSGVMDADWFDGSTNELLGERLLERVTAPIKVIHNRVASQRLRALHQTKNYDCLEIHNALPALSPSIYSTAFELELPIIHFVHNYRLSCVNGAFLNHGQQCYRCIDGNFLSAFTTKCWRNNRAACGLMGLALSRIRHLETFDRVAAWVALSVAQKKLLIRMGLPESRLHVVPHYLEPVRHRASGPPRDGYALFLGRLSPEKGVLQLIRAWEKVPTNLGRLVIAGTGPLESEAMQLAARLRLSNIEFRGFVPPTEHEKLWAGTKFAVVPSVWDEPFGLVVLEAWAHGRTLIVSNSGALPEIAGEGALTVQMAKEGELANAIRTLLQDIELAAELTKRGEERLRSRYNRLLWFERMRAVYGSCGIQV